VIGNSAYGRTIMNKNKFHTVKFCNEKQFNRAKNNYFFCDAEYYDGKFVCDDSKSADEHIKDPFNVDDEEDIEEDELVQGSKDKLFNEDGIYEVSTRKRVVKQNMPIQVGFNVLLEAKLRMLQFDYDFIDKYIDRSNYQKMYMDTDSCYSAFTDKIENLIKPELQEEYEKDKQNWFPRTDENKAYDTRTPGLFKEEYNGDGMVALCSKTYYCVGKKAKFSVKGTQKERNKDILSFLKYLYVLQTGTNVESVNRGFRSVDKYTKTYQQTKIAMTNIYVKGVVMEDGVHIRPLDI
jgi:hypothetical protein